MSPASRRKAPDPHLRYLLVPTAHTIGFLRNTLSTRYVAALNQRNTQIRIRRTAKFIMSYPGAPGSSSSSTLPPRPPPSKVSGFKPAFRSAAPSTPYGTTTAPSAPTYSSAPSYAGAPPGVARYGAGAPPPSYQSYGAPGAGMSSGVSYPPPQQTAYSSYPQQSAYQANYYGGAQPAATTAAAAASATSAYAAPPQIRNPFPMPGQAAKNDDYDPDMAAQIAQWQSAYARDPKEAAAIAASAFPGRPGLAAPNMSAAFSVEAANRASEAANAAAATAAVSGEKKKTVVRSGGGQKWTDDTLVEWDPAHLRLFVGNLAGETTDESLFKAFSRWKSLQKARVIRDKVTTKSKGFGFVSFSDPDEFFAAAKEMNGKYIQSHPVVVRKSTTEIKPTIVKEKHHGGKWNKNNRNKNHRNNHNNDNNNNNKNRSGNGSGAGAGGRENSFEPHLGPTGGGGVTKPGSKTKDGLRLLG
ncbi:RNA-binding domain-containing protein [Xylariaceae sp. FL0594]|nr:RNA-binding domain-containing protein [Xylariaceae sp. FL0594]